MVSWALRQTVSQCSWGSAGDDLHASGLQQAMALLCTAMAMLGRQGGGAQRAAPAAS